MIDLIADRSAAARAAFFLPADRVSGDRTNEVSRVLIVEDDYVVGLELEAALSEAGFGVVGTANSAQEAVRLAISERPILAVMDVRLVGRRDGVEAAIEMFDRCGVRCVFATAHNDAATRARAESAAPLGWLAKPYQLDALIAMVKAAVDELNDTRS